MKQLIVFIGFLFFINFAKAQYIFPERFYNCTTNGMSLENEHKYVDYKNNDSLYDDLIKNASEEFISKLEGEIMIQLVVDSEGRSCCISILNKSNVSSKKLKLVKNINSMTGWEKPTKKNKKICVIIDLIFDPDKVTIKRLGVNYSQKFTELSHYEISRNKDSN